MTEFGDRIPLRQVPLSTEEDSEQDDSSYLIGHGKISSYAWSSENEKPGCSPSE